MIPEIDTAFRKEIRHAVREKVCDRLASSTESVGKRIRLRIERAKYRLGLRSESNLLCVLLMLLLLFPLLGNAIALYRVSMWLVELETVSISYRGEVPAIMAMSSSIAFGIVMFMFAFGVNAMRQKLSLFYPHQDDSLKHYVSTRTFAGTLAAFAFSLASYALATLKLDAVPLNFAWAIGYATLQSLFLVSIALILARKLPLGFGESASHSFCFIGMILYGFVVWAFLAAPELPDDAVLLLCSPHVWANTTVYFLCVTPHPIGWTLLISIGLVIGKGIQSYRELVKMEPANRLNGDECGVVKEAVLRESNEATESTAASVLQRIQAYDQPPTGGFEKMAVMLFPKSKLQPRFAPFRNSDDDSDRIKSVWERGCELMLVLIAVVLVSSLAGAGIWWLATAYYYQIQSSAMLFCTVILLIPWLATLQYFGRYVSSTLYPVSVLSFSKTFCATWLRSFCLVLPVVFLLNTAFCLRFDLNGFESFWFVIRPVAFTVGFVLISIAIQFSFMSGHSDMRLVMLFGWALFLFTALISSLMMLTAPVRDFGAGAIVVSQIATGAWLSTTFGFSIACLALQHFGNFDVPDEVLRLSNRGMKLDR